MGNEPLANAFFLKTTLIEDILFWFWVQHRYNKWVLKCSSKEAKRKAKNHKILIFKTKEIKCNHLKINNLRLVGREYSIGRYYQHNRTLKHLRKFKQKEFDEDDFPIKKVDLQFIQRFEHHLLVSRAGGRNTVSKYVTISKRSCE